jgi:hypothetical protein
MAAVVGALEEGGHKESMNTSNWRLQPPNGNQLHGAEHYSRDP